jgi:hypothetical protein
MSITLGAFDIPDISGVDSTPVFKWLLVIMQTFTFYFRYHGKVSIEPGINWTLRLHGL